MSFGTASRRDSPRSQSAHMARTRRRQESLQLPCSPGCCYVRTAVERKRRTIATALRTPAARSAEAFSLGIERYRDAVRNLGKHVPYSDQAAEERRLVRELLGGHGTVFTRTGRIGARFRSASLLDMEEFSYKSKTSIIVVAGARFCVGSP